MEIDMQKSIKRRKIWGRIISIILVLLVIWFSFALYEMYRVKSDKSTLICLKKVRDVEDDDEYSIMCYGLLYKYKEYYYIENDKMSAREFTMFFTDFKRDTSK